MSKSNCTVCGRHKEACLHQREWKDERNDRQVSRVLWFAFGFLTSAASVILIIIFNFI